MENKVVWISEQNAMQGVGTEIYQWQRVMFGSNIRLWKDMKSMEEDKRKN
jgi:hypothetical protein